MPFETPTLPVLVGRAQADLAGDALRRSDAQVLARTHAGVAYGLYGYLNWLADQILPDSADEETLERIAALRLNEPRKPAQPASGPASFMAAAGGVLDVGTVLQAGDGRTYKVTTGVTTVAGLNSTTLEAVDAGTLGNAEAGLQLTLVQPVERIASTFTVLAPGLAGGVAQESVEALRARVVRSYRVIAQGGSADDYETWALEVPGVTRAWCRRNYLGPGTVGLFVMRDSDDVPVPNPAQLAEVKTYIESPRPVTAELYVLPPVLVPVPYSIKAVPDTSAVRGAITRQLSDLHQREAGLGAPLLITHIRATVSGSPGETDHVLATPVADVVAATNQILTLGVITWL
ncbi:baseplate J/gp47 family protein [Pseudomonas sp. ES3]|uniref:baseplate J/gp47 family protein n=1 Tax=Pseudomonas sp. ES3 TaxID=3424776 RepID=UPI003D33E782